MEQTHSRIFENVTREELERLAHLLAPLSTQGDFIALKGKLGAGKTTFARAYIRTALGEVNLDVPSPTYTLIQNYPGKGGYPDILHVDLYRIERPEEIRELGLEDAGDSIVLLEWPERLGEDLPKEALLVSLEFGSEGKTRNATLNFGPGWQRRIKNLNLIRTGG